jgi:hypothetical protein
LIAALFLALMPLHVMHSKFMAVDVPATFFVSLALLYALRITQEGGKWRDYLLAGFFTGFAAATKYNTGLVILSPVVAHMMMGKAGLRQKIFNSKLFSMLVVTVAGFLIGTPGVLINYAKFSKDFLFEVNHVRTGHGLVFVNTGLGWTYHFMHSLLPGMGLPLLVLAVVGLIFALKRWTPADYILLTFALVYYLMIGAAQVRFARYVIPLLPILAVLAARACAEVMEGVSPNYSRQTSPTCPRERPRSPGLAPQFLCIVIVVVVCAYTLLSSLALNSMFNRPDTRELAANWIKKSIPEGTSIGLPTIPWYYTPPLDPEMGMAASSQQRYDASQMFTEYRLVVPRDPGWDTEQLEQSKPEYVVLSEAEYTDRLRLKDVDAEKYFRALDQDYNLVRRFADQPWIFGFQPPLMGKLPHDMSYASPTILIYARKV